MLKTKSTFCLVLSLSFRLSGILLFWKKARKSQVDYELLKITHSHTQA
jgi:hypothetical protein